MSRSFFSLADLVPCFLSLPSLPFHPHSCFLPHRKQVQPLTNQLSLKGPSFPLIQVILHVTSASAPQLHLIYFPLLCISTYDRLYGHLRTFSIFLCLLKRPVSSFCCWFSSSLEFLVLLFALLYFILDLTYWWGFNRIILTDSTGGGFSRLLHKWLLPLAWQPPHTKSFENSTGYELTWL